MLQKQTALSAPQQKQTFRMSWLRLYAAMTLWVIALLAFPVLLQLLAGQRFTLRDISIAAASLLVGLFFEFVFAALIAICYPVHLSTEGLNGFNFWGFRQTILWEDIASATLLRFMNLPWLIVRSHRTKNALWLPLFFTDNRKFREAVLQFASPNCPLVAFGQTVN